MRRFSVPFMVLLAAIASRAHAAPENPPGLQVQSADIGPSVQIIGRLGHPLGTVLSIEGKPIELQLKDNAKYIEVTKVEGTPTPKPIVLSYTVPSWSTKSTKLPLTLLTSYRMRVYEDGGMKGIPASAMPNPVQTTDYHFTTWLVIVDVQK